MDVYLSIAALWQMPVCTLSAECSEPLLTNNKILSFLWKESISRAVNLHNVLLVFREVAPEVGKMP